MMETSTLLLAQQWAEETFGEVRLGHRSREERAVTMAAAIAADPAGSLPKQMGSEAVVLQKLAEERHGQSLPFLVGLRRPLQTGGR